MIGCGIAYTFLISYIYQGWQKKDVLSDYKPLVSRGISVVIAARNEEQNIGACLTSILSNEFPIGLYEIIVIDDGSIDDTISCVAGFNQSHIRVVTLPDGKYGKKTAITHAIELSKFPIIVCTDADCVVGSQWLAHLANLYSDLDLHMTTGVVLPKANQSLLGRFQWLDMAATMAITKNGIVRNQYYLANGANISFIKDKFYQVGGYEGNQNVPSGDDLFLIQKFANLPDTKIKFVDHIDAIVETNAVGHWRDFVAQRKRWATKSKIVGDTNLMMIQGFVFLFSVFILCSITIGLLTQLAILLTAIFVILAKAITDFIFLRKLSRYYHSSDAMRSFIPCFLLYFVHIIYSGWLAIFPRSYVWKGRELP